MFDPNRLPCKAYNILVELHEEGKACWLSEVCWFCTWFWLYLGESKCAKFWQISLCLSNFLLTVINKTDIVMLQKALGWMFTRILSQNYTWDLIYTVNKKALGNDLIWYQTEISYHKTHKKRYKTALVPDLNMKMMKHTSSNVLIHEDLSCRFSCHWNIQLVNLTLPSQLCLMIHHTLYGQIFLPSQPT